MINEDLKIAVNDLENTGNSLTTAIQTLEIQTIDDCKTGVSYLKRIKEMEQEIEDREKEFTKPLNDTIKKIREVFKPEKVKIKQAKEKLEKELLVPFFENNPTIKKVETNITKTEIRKLVSFEVINEDIVPRVYCEPSKSKINEAMKSGIDNIPGISIKEITSLVSKEPISNQSKKSDTMIGVVDD